jgi:CheY-like chemotaxis protein
MPKLTGVDVLKFIRSEASLEALPVVVLSNSYMNQLAAEAATLGVQKALLKVRCSPAVLLGIINEVLTGESGGEDTSHLLAVPDQSPSAQPSQARGKAKTATAELHADARRSFLGDARATCKALRGLCQAVITAPTEAERNPCLEELYRKVHSIVAAAGLAECHHLAQMASAFEALLFELVGKPEAVSPSVLRTIAATVDFLALLFDCARDAEREAPLSAQTLVVDDDLLSNRLIVGALQLAQLKARSTDDPWLALQWLKESPYDLVLLDIKMPEMDGFELCRRLRTMPGYEKTPVIYVTAHSDFETRAQSILSGGDDLISKPVFSLELIVKVVAHLLKRQLAA